MGLGAWEGQEMCIMAAPFVLNWGILGCGGIASRFTQDLLVTPQERGVTDVVHHVVAVGSSSSLAKASEFAQRLGLEGKELLSDPAISVIYVATPHSLHRDNVLSSLRAGKHVLCEKPFAISRAEAQECFDLARDKNLFLMEAMWTRFFPLTAKIREFISEGKVGKVLQVQADFGVPFNIDSLPHTHRILDPKLGGGALLDLGVYPITWAYICLYTLNGRESPRVTSTMLRSTATNVGRYTAALMTFARAEAVALISCNLDADSGSVVVVHGTKGSIRVRAPLYRPSAFELKIGEEESQVFELNVVGGGMYFQADEVARCIRDGKVESTVMLWDESLEIMRAMDEIRKQGGLVYPMEE